MKTERLRHVFDSGRMKCLAVPGMNHLFLADPSGWSGGYARLPSKDVPLEVLGAIADWLSEIVRR